MKYPKENSSRSNDFQTRRLSNFQRFAVPMTAKRFRDFVCMAILPAAEPLAITPAVFQ
jgi:hypothetical protein